MCEFTRLYPMSLIIHIEQVVKKAHTFVSLFLVIPLWIYVPFKYSIYKYSRKLYYGLKLYGLITGNKQQMT